MAQAPLPRSIGEGDWPRGRAAGLSGAITVRRAFCVANLVYSLEKLIQLNSDKTSNDFSIRILSAANDDS